MKIWLHPIEEIILSKESLILTFEQKFEYWSLHGRRPLSPIACGKSSLAIVSKIW